METESIIDSEPVSSTVSQNHASFKKEEDDFWNQMYKQVLMMSDYALANGVKIPENVKKCLIDFESKDELLDAHMVLSELIAPTTPKSLEYNVSIKDESKTGFWRHISPYPIIRELFVATLIAAMIFMATGLTEDVNSVNLSHGLLESSGLPLLYNSLFIASAAALGSCFSLLTEALSKIKSVSLNSGDKPYFRATLMLGIISGLLLSEVVVTKDTTIESAISLNRMILALMGGFSSELVYKTMQALMEKLKQLVTF